MGTDWVQLFDRKLCDEIRALDSSSIIPFVDLHFDRMHRHSLFRVDPPSTAAERVQRLRDGGESDEDLKLNLVLSLCLSDKDLYLDYWACYAEVFGSDPPGSVPDTALFPHLTEQWFLLLKPEHVEKMLASLSSHRSEITIMQEEDLQLLREWHNRCQIDSNTAVAYFFDY